VGDVIVSAAGQPVKSIEGLRDRLGGDRVGAQLTLKLVRGGQAQERSLEVAERPQRHCH